MTLILTTLIYFIQGNKYLNLIQVYRKKIEDELTTICREVLELLDNYLLKQS